MEERVIACSLADVELARRSDLVRRDLFAGALVRAELAAGYAFRFPGDGDWDARIQEFVGIERRCCSFFQFEIVFEAGMGSIWLRLTGPEGTKQFIEQAFE
ncbi:MAG TPA: hypothetical protein VFQ54_01925 [Thermomicrobiales bacterium]|nr:hypothetical protein [Thermomicrobiales bacterium]